MSAAPWLSPAASGPAEARQWKPICSAARRAIRAQVRPSEWVVCFGPVRHRLVCSWRAPARPARRRQPGPCGGAGASRRGPRGAGEGVRGVPNKGGWVTGRRLPGRVWNRPPRLGLTARAARSRPCGRREQQQTPYPTACAVRARIRPNHSVASLPGCVARDRGVPARGRGQGRRRRSRGDGELGPRAAGWEAGCAGPAVSGGACKRAEPRGRAWSIAAGTSESWTARHCQRRRACRRRPGLGAAALPVAVAVGPWQLSWAAAADLLARF